MVSKLTQFKNNNPPSRESEKGGAVRCVAESNHCDRFCRPAPDHSANAPFGNANIRHFPESTRPDPKMFCIFEEH